MTSENVTSEILFEFSSVLFRNGGSIQITIKPEIVEKFGWVEGDEMTLAIIRSNCSEFLGIWKKMK
ncbi:MAG: AbrB/MazE/SpoVT family DNA-binding domain-containing protein [Bacillota bacterium]